MYLTLQSAKNILHLSYLLAISSFWVQQLWKTRNLHSITRFLFKKKNNLKSLKKKKSYLFRSLQHMAVLILFYFSVLLISNISASLSFCSVPDEHIQKTEVCKFKTLIINKTKLMSHNFIAQWKQYFEILSNMILTKMKHTVLPLLQNDISKACQSTFWGLICGWSNQKRSSLRGLRYSRTTGESFWQYNDLP